MQFAMVIGVGVGNIGLIRYYGQVYCLNHIEKLEWMRDHVFDPPANDQEKKKILEYK